MVDALNILAFTWLEISLEMLPRRYFVKCKAHIHAVSQQGQTPITKVWPLQVTSS